MKKPRARLSLNKETLRKLSQATLTLARLTPLVAIGAAAAGCHDIITSQC